MCLEITLYVYQKGNKICSISNLPVLNVSGTFTIHQKNTVVALVTGLFGDSEGLLWFSQFPFSLILHFCQRFLIVMKISKCYTAAFQMQKGLDTVDLILSSLPQHLNRSNCTDFLGVPLDLHSCECEKGQVLLFNYYFNYPSNLLMQPIIRDCPGEAWR